VGPGMGGITVQQVEALLVERLGCEHVVCEDISGGCGQSFDLVEVVTRAFEGKNRLKRHRLINEALKEELETIHALGIKKCYTPEEYSTR